MLKLNIEKPHQIYADVVEQSALDQFESAMTLDCVIQGSMQLIKNLHKSTHSSTILGIFCLEFVDNFSILE